MKTIEAIKQSLKDGKTVCTSIDSEILDHLEAIHEKNKLRDELLRKLIDFSRFRRGGWEELRAILDNLTTPANEPEKSGKEAAENLTRAFAVEDEWDIITPDNHKEFEPLQKTDEVKVGNEWIPNENFNSGRGFGFVATYRRKRIKPPTNDQFMLAEKCQRLEKELASRPTLKELNELADAHNKLWIELAECKGRIDSFLVSGHSPKLDACNCGACKNYRLLTHLDILRGEQKGATA